MAFALCAVMVGVSSSAIAAEDIVTSAIIMARKAANFFFTFTQLLCRFG